MIPLLLTLKNFLSYRDATLDFRGLHTACVCGSNGAGKSSLLEAITWSIWGESRATSEDDVIQTGAKEVRVDFTFETTQQVYKVIRTRRRGASSSLEFQVETPEGFRSLTAKGLRATQELVLEHIKLDYDTFINSAYLRQGRADEFMLKRPSERKEILAELLKLNQYDDLEERAKELSRQFKIRGEELTRSLEHTKTQLQQKETTTTQKAELEAQIDQLQQQQEFSKIELQSLQNILHQRQNWEQQLNFVRQQFQNLTQDCDRLSQEQSAVSSQLLELEKIVTQAEQIKAGFAQYQSLHSQEEGMSTKFEAHNRAQHSRQQKQQQLDGQVRKIERQLQQTQAQLEALTQQEDEVTRTLSKIDEVEVALEQLGAARSRLSHYEQLQLKVSPLLQRKVSLQTQIDKAQAGILARLEQLQTTQYQLQSRTQRHGQLQQAVMDVATQIEEMDKTRVYLQRVQEKGQERRHFMERLQAQQREYERLLGELEQKLQMLQTPDAVCPLCERPLEEHDWNTVVSKTREEYKDTEGRLWVFRDQMACSEREIQVLRQEYRDVSKKLSQYDALREHRGQLAAQLDSCSDAEKELEQLSSERQVLEKALQQGEYAPDTKSELEQLEEYLQELNYNEQDHALARSEVERWRWAEIKLSQIKDANKRKEHLAARKPELQTQISQLENRSQQESISSECAREIAAIDAQILEIAYNREQHHQVRVALRQTQSWQLRYQQLQASEKQYPQLQTRIQELQISLQSRLERKQELAAQIEEIINKLQETANPINQIQQLEQQMSARRAQLDNYLSQFGRLQQLIQQLENLEKESQQQQEQLKSCRQQHRIYQELSQAFGKNGIQTLMIENVLPQLEAQTNHLLSRLSANQLHVQFVTQKASKTKSKKKSKLIDTLDILIADAKGTRSYETYSGGEAFRINFAIRLALARLLAQRAGAALQLLIVDEGFGTQDDEGCERLISAINAIAPDFSCILTVTHMPHLKAAFQARIEVNKTQNGSQIQLSV
ncbi:MAG: exonuclease subunit SbcC [Mastigocoleus sp.]